MFDYAHAACENAILGKAAPSLMLFICIKNTGCDP